MVLDVGRSSLRISVHAPRGLFAKAVIIRGSDVCDLPQTGANTGHDAYSNHSRWKIGTRHCLSYGTLKRTPCLVSRFVSTFLTNRRALFHSAHKHPPQNQPYAGPFYIAQLTHTDSNWLGY